MATAKKETSNAMTMLQNAKSVSERAEAFYGGIKRDINDEVIVSLEKKIEKLKEKEFELADFSLETDVNRGQRRMTQEDCTNRFRELVDVKYKISILELELKMKSAIVKELF